MIREYECASCLNHTYCHSTRDIHSIRRMMGIVTFARLAALVSNPRPLGRSVDGSLIAHPASNTIIFRPSNVFSLLSLGAFPSSPLVSPLTLHLSALLYYQGTMCPPSHHPLSSATRHRGSRHSGFGASAAVFGASSSETWAVPCEVSPPACRLCSRPPLPTCLLSVSSVCCMSNASTRGTNSSLQKTGI